MNYVTCISPSDGSIVSEQLLDSMHLLWEDNRETDKYVVSLYEISPNRINGAAILLEEKTTVDNTFSILGFDAKLKDEKFYGWNVRSSRDKERKDAQVYLFKYKEGQMATTVSRVMERVPSDYELNWGTTEKRGNEITRDLFSRAIKQNLSSLLNDYPSLRKYISNSNNLFLDDTVLDADEMRLFESLLICIGQLEGITYLPYDEGRREARPNTLDKKLDNGTFIDVVKNTSKTTEILDTKKWFYNGIGSNGMQKIRNYMEMLSNMPPKEAYVSDIIIENNRSPVISSLTARNDHEQDLTIDVSWDVEAFPTSRAVVTVVSDSSSEDVWMYKVDCTYTCNGNTTQSTKYYQKSDFVDGRKIVLLENLQSITPAGAESRITANVTAIDNRRNLSYTTEKTLYLNRNNTFPMGVDYFEMESQLTDSSSTGYNVNGQWVQQHRGTGKNKTYTANREFGKAWHRVRYTDKNGRVSDWEYASSAVIFDSLTLPDAPTGLWFNAITHNSFNFWWNHAPRADYYEVECNSNNITYPVHGNNGTWYSEAYGVRPQTKYQCWVRSVNRRGKSAWSSAYVTTANPPEVDIWQTASHSWTGQRKPGGTYGQWLNVWDCWQGAGIKTTNADQYGGVWYFNKDAIRNAAGGRWVKEAYLEVKCHEVAGGGGSKIYLYTHTHEAGTGGNMLDRISGNGGDGGPYVPGNTIYAGQTVRIPLSRVYIDRMMGARSFNGLHCYRPVGKSWRGPVAKFSGNARIILKF